MSDLFNGSEVDGIYLDTKVLDKITAELEPRASKIVKRTALKVQQNAQELAPVDNGVLKNSIMAEEKDGPLSWWVHDGVEYGAAQEFGTSRFAAQPFMTPAVEQERQQFEDDFKELFE
jgi:HK97 gp10 family phage protein